MTAKTMAEVLEELDAHRPDHREYEGGWWELACAGCDFAKGQRLSHLDWAPYRAHRAEVFAAALAATGYGLVADAKREALEEAAAVLEAHPRLRKSQLAWAIYPDHMATKEKSFNECADILRARAAEMRQG